jgi:hypothetical protein
MSFPSSNVEAVADGIRLMNIDEPHDHGVSASTSSEQTPASSAGLTEHAMLESMYSIWAKMGTFAKEKALEDGDVSTGRLAGKRVVKMSQERKFTGRDVTEWLVGYEEETEVIGATKDEEKVIGVVTNTSVEHVRNHIRSLDGFEERNWSVFRPALIREYRDSDCAIRKKTMAYLEELCKLKNKDMKSYIAEFKRWGSAVKKAGVASDQWVSGCFLRGFSKDDQDELLKDAISPYDDDGVTSFLLSFEDFVVNARAITERKTKIRNMVGDDSVSAAAATLVREQVRSKPAVRDPSANVLNSDFQEHVTQIMQKAPSWYAACHILESSADATVLELRKHTGQYALALSQLENHFDAKSQVSTTGQSDRQRQNVTGGQWGNTAHSGGSGYGRNGGDGSSRPLRNWQAEGAGGNNGAWCCENPNWTHKFGDRCERMQEIYRKGIAYWNREERKVHWGTANNDLGSARLQIYKAGTVPEYDIQVMNKISQGYAPESIRSIAQPTDSGLGKLSAVDNIQPRLSPGSDNDQSIYYVYDRQAAKYSQGVDAASRAKGKAPVKATVKHARRGYMEGPREELSDGDEDELAQSRESQGTAQPNLGTSEPSASANTGFRTGRASEAPQNDSQSFRPTLNKFLQVGDHVETVADVTMRMLTTPSVHLSPLEVLRISKPIQDTLFRTMPEDLASQVRPRIEVGLQKRQDKKAELAARRADQQVNGMMDRRTAVVEEVEDEEEITKKQRAAAQLASLLDAGNTPLSQLAGVHQIGSARSLMTKPMQPPAQSWDEIRQADAQNGRRRFGSQSPTVSIALEPQGVKQQIRSLVDTGATLNCMSADVAYRSQLVINQVTDDMIMLQAIRGANRTTLNIVGWTLAEVQITGAPFTYQEVCFAVVERLSWPVILGQDFGTMAQLDIRLQANGECICAAWSTSGDRFCQWIAAPRHGFHDAVADDEEIDMVAGQSQQGNV